MTATTTTTTTEENIKYFSDNFNKDGLDHLKYEMLNKLYILERQQDFYTNQAKTFTMMVETNAHTIEGLKEELDIIKAVIKYKKNQTV